MNATRRRRGLTALAVLVALVVLLSWWPIPSPAGWPGGLRQYVNPLQGARVIDEAGNVLSSTTSTTATSASSASRRCRAAGGG